MNKKITKIIIVLLIGLFGLSLRLFAAGHLPVDMDEPVYLTAALDYNNFIREGQWTQLAWYDGNSEHPSLSKIAYALALLTQDPLERLYYQKDFSRLSAIQASEAKPWAMAGRYTSIFFSTIAILFLSVLSPLAGLFLSIHTICIQYTSEIYLEALPLLTGLLSVLAYSQWFKKGSEAEFKLKDPNHIWLFLSAMFLGMTAASKYTHCIAGIAILIHYVLHLIRDKKDKKNLLVIIGWGLLSVFMFYIFNPYLWPHPFERLWGTLTYHMDYHNSAIVQRYDYKFWQPLAWLTKSAPGHFPYLADSFLIRLDPLISILALIGLPRLYKQRQVFFIWLTSALILLLLWPTKWPQYILILVAPLAMSAAEGVNTIWHFAARYLKKQKERKGEVYEK